MSRVNRPHLDLRLPDTFRAVVQSCEVNCVAGCCGLDAFEFIPKHIVGWAKDSGSRQGLFCALEEISEVIGQVRDQGGPVQVVEELNAWWDEPEECIAVFREVQRVIRNAIEELTQQSLFQAEWATSTVLRLAEAIYADRAFDRLPILADALEDVGCDNADLLAHCRRPGPHARGCWVVDLILGKT